MKEAFSCGVCGEAFEEETRLDHHLIAHHEAHSDLNLNKDIADTAQNFDTLVTGDEYNQDQHGETLELELVDLSTIQIAIDNENTNEDVENPYIIEPRQESASERISDGPGVNKRDRLCRFVCCYCSKRCMTKEELANHEVTHTKQRPHQCNLCCKTYTSPSALFKHMKEKHSCAKPNLRTLPAEARDSHIYKHMCSFCGKGFQEKGGLQMHERIHTGERPFQCSQCKSRFRTRGSCFMHMRRIHNKEPLLKKTACVRVDEVTRDEVRMNIEAKVEAEPHNVTEKTRTPDPANESAYKDVSSRVGSLPDQNIQKLHKCPYCPKTWKKNSELIKHVRYHTGEKPFSCPVCSKTFFRTCQRNAHIKRWHDWEAVSNVFEAVRNKNKIHKCPYCPKIWKKHCELVKHVRYHTGEKPFKCHVCSKAFFMKFERTRHVREYHGKEPSRSENDELPKQINSYKCPYCPKTLTCRRDLIVHTRSHTGGQPYQCPLCQKTFYERSNFKSHMMTHHDWVANKQLYKQTVAHIKISNNVTNLMASDDESSDEVEDTNNEKSGPIGESGENGNMKRKRSTRDEINVSSYRFTCSFCNKKWKNGALLRIHERIHTGEKPFKCSECQRAFNTRASYNKHMLRKHNIQPERLKAKFLKLANADVTNNNCVSNVEEENGCNGAVITNKDEEEYVSTRKSSSVNIGNQKLSNEMDEEREMDLEVTAFDYKCSFCDVASFQTFQERDEHEITHARSDLCKIDKNSSWYVQNRKFKCSFCTKRWGSRTARRQHERTHTGEKPITCSEPGCKKSFRTRGSLFKHVRIFHKKEPILKVVPLTRIGNNVDKIDDTTRLVGEKSTVSASGATINLKEVSNLSPAGHWFCKENGKRSFEFKCPFCPKLFLRIYMLIRHVRSHTGEKPFKCPACHKTYNRPHYVFEHVKLSHDWEVYKHRMPFPETRQTCPYCPKLFNSQVELIDHLKAVHIHMDGEASKTQDRNTVQSVKISLENGQRVSLLNNIIVDEISISQKCGNKVQSVKTSVENGQPVSVSQEDNNIVDKKNVSQKCENGLRSCSKERNMTGNELPNVASLQSCRQRKLECVVKLQMLNVNSDDSHVFRLNSVVNNHSDVLSRQSGVNIDGNLLPLQDGMSDDVNVLSLQDGVSDDGNVLSRQDGVSDDGNVLSLQDGVSDDGNVLSSQDGVSDDGNVLSLQDGVSDDGNVLSLQDGVSDYGNVLSLQDGVSDDVNVLSLQDGVSDDGNVLSRQNGVSDDGNVLSRQNGVSDDGNVLLRQDRVNDDGNVLPNNDDGNVLPLQGGVSYDEGYLEHKTSDRMKVPFHKTRALNESSVSIINCEHGLRNEHRHSRSSAAGKKIIHSSSSTAQKLKVIKIHYNGQVKMFTLTPFDCSECISETATPEPPSCQKQENLDDTVNTTEDDHPYSKPSSNLNMDSLFHDANLNSVTDSSSCDADLSHAMDFIAQSQNFKMEIPEMMAMNEGPTQGRENFMGAIDEIKVEPVDVVYS